VRDNVVPLPDRAVEAPSEAQPVSLNAGLAQIRAADPNFEPKTFLQGARGAFEIIVHAFAAGDTATLRPLLSDEVFERFNEAIRARVAAKETHETRLDSIKSAEIAEAQLNGRTAFVTVRFASDQVNVTRAADGTVLDGEPERIVEKTDFWTFARNTRSQDPNWLLVATRSG
jgi:predicted lipid-binding transport protein (Tim44 family)